MARKVEVLIEFQSEHIDYDECNEAIKCESTRGQLTNRLSKSMSGLGFNTSPDVPPTPLFIDDDPPSAEAFSARAHISKDDTPKRGKYILSATIDEDKREDLLHKSNVEAVWPNSPLTYFGDCGCHSGGSNFDGINADGVNPDGYSGIPMGYPGIPMGYPGIPMGYPGVPMGYPGIPPRTMGYPGIPMNVAEALDEVARSTNGADCRPFRAGVSVDVIRALLGVDRVWSDGFRGQNIVVGILDEGVNGDFYPVIGGITQPGAPRPGSASITSHGSMCAADILVAAPLAKILDYPFLGVPTSGGAIAMFQAVLEQRGIDGTPHLTNNSYGFGGIPSDPAHEVNNRNHPVHRKVREVIQSGCPCFFSAGNCGQDCPSGTCHSSGIGPGNSILASNSLEEVITVAAVNSRHERIGYSAQGPGRFEPAKPDIAAYSHFFGNFGPGRPGGLSQPFDNGTSASCPVAAGVGALLLSAFQGRGVTPEQLKAVLQTTATEVGPAGFDRDFGHGVINAAAAYMKMFWTDDLDDLL